MRQHAYVTWSTGLLNGQISHVITGIALLQITVTRETKVTVRPPDHGNL